MTVDDMRCVRKMKKKAFALLGEIFGVYLDEKKVMVEETTLVSESF